MGLRKARKGPAALHRLDRIPRRSVGGEMLFRIHGLLNLLLLFWLR